MPEIGLVCRLIDLRDKNAFSRMSPEDQKDFSPFITTRFISFVKSNDSDVQEWFIESTNEFVNKNGYPLHKNHKELIWKLYSCCGTGEIVYHQYQKAPSGKTKVDKFERFLSDLNPTMKIDDVKLLAELMSSKERKQLFDDLGLDAEERKLYQ